MTQRGIGGLHANIDQHPPTNFDGGNPLWEEVLHDEQSQTTVLSHKAATHLPDQTFLHSLNVIELSWLEPQHQIDYLRAHLIVLRQYRSKLYRAMEDLDRANMSAFEEEAQALRDRFAKNKEEHPNQRNYSITIPGKQLVWYSSYLKFAFRYDQYPEPSPKLRDYLQRLEMEKRQYIDPRRLDSQLWSGSSALSKADLALEDETLEYEYAIESYRCWTKLHKAREEERENLQSWIKWFKTELQTCIVAEEEHCETHLRHLTVSDRAILLDKGRSKNLARRDSAIGTHGADGEMLIGGSVSGTTRFSSWDREEPLTSMSGCRKCRSHEAYRMRRRAPPDGKKKLIDLVPEFIGE